MISQNDCARDLRSYIRAGNRDDLGAAQDVLLRFALSLEDPGARTAALDDLQAELAGYRVPDMTNDQRAFDTAVTSLIEQTKAVVGQQGGPAR